MPYLRIWFYLMFVSCVGSMLGSPAIAGEEAPPSFGLLMCIGPTYSFEDSPKDYGFGAQAGLGYQFRVITRRTLALSLVVRGDIYFLPYTKVLRFGYPYTQTETSIEFDGIGSFSADFILTRISGRLAGLYALGGLGGVVDGSALFCLGLGTDLTSSYSRGFTPFAELRGYAGDLRSVAFVIGVRLGS